MARDIRLQARVLRFRVRGFRNQEKKPYHSRATTRRVAAQNAFTEGDYFPQHCLYFFPLPQGHGVLRPGFSAE